MSPGAEDGSLSPGRESSSIMVEDKIDRASTDEKSPARAGIENKPPPKSNPKDPSRPRRKKARRACFACQRAHLTCGDERPCLRCIKRGLQDQCHDGVRKKAKYLHDAPPEALMPSFPPNSNNNNQYPANGSQNSQPPQGSNPMAQNGIAISQPPNFMSQTPSSNFPQFNPVNHAGRMSGPLMEGNDPMLGGNFGQSVETPSQFQSTPTQQTSPVQTIPGSMDQPPTIETSGGGSYDQGFIDPNDPSLFNFDISGLNFGNHYGALEFGMLGHMSGAVGTPDVDLNSMGGQSHHGSLSYDNTSGYNPSNNNFNFNQFPGWQGLTRQTSNNNVWTASTNGMDAFAIGEASIMGQSPASQSQDFNSNYQSGGTMSPENQFAQVDQNQNHSHELLRQSFAQPAPQQPQRKQVPPYNGGNNQRKRRRDISEIYTSVTAPYPYTQGFHALTAFLQKRFPSKKTLRIAKALASIRPSFISCNKNLGHEDLIFMEKCFQRTLCEYEDFVNHYGTPTIICRRTGEIASVSKEFSLVTGWRRDVLLGKEPNLNVNTGSNNSGTQTGTSSRGAVTPRAPNVDIDPGRPQPVFLAELMDEDSVCQFYEDFAELAFGASRASIIGPTVSLLKYKTKDDAGWGANDFNDEGRRAKRSSSGEVKMETLMKGEAGTKALGDRDGRVDCSMCWTVKRDTFDIPMLIVMNFLPII